MNIGLHFNYNNSDQSIIALCLARQLELAGYAVFLMSKGNRAKTVDCHWDNRVQNGDISDYPAWSVTKDTIIWIENDNSIAGYMQYAKERGVRTVLYSLWETIQPAHQALYTLADAIACPIIHATLLLREKWKLPAVHYWPVDPGVPLTTKPPPLSDKPFRLLLPACGSQTYNVSMGVFDVIKDISKRTDVVLTVLSSNKFAGFAKKELRRLHDVPNIKLIQDPTWPAIIEQIMEADLMIKPSIVDGSGLLYLAAAFAGTPTVVFDFSPMNEQIAKNKRAYIVDAGNRGTTKFGATMYEPDYGKFIALLGAFLNNKHNISTLMSRIEPEYLQHMRLSDEGMRTTVEVRHE